MKIGQFQKSSRILSGVIGSVALSFAMHSHGVEIDYAKLSSKDDSVVRDAAQLELFLSNSGSQVFGRSLNDASEQIEVEYLGKGKSSFRTEDETYDTQTRSARPLPKRLAAFEEDSNFIYMDLYNPDTENEFRVKMPRSKITKAMENPDLSRNQSESVSQFNIDKFGAKSDTQAVARALSNGIDSRQVVGVYNVAHQDSIGRKMVDIGNCSGALIGPKHVLTAGHCVWSKKNNTWSKPVLRVGRSGNDWLHSRNMATNNSRWFWTPSCYRTSNERGCDIGMYIADAATSATGIGEENGVGWFGWYWTSNDNTFINSWGPSFKNAGYPICTDDADSPANCEDNVNALYSDVGNCDVGSVKSPGPDGIDRIFYHDCDASKGQSGSPIYMRTGSGSLVIVGVHTHSLCRDCDNRDRYPSGATRITKEYSDTISTLRNQFQ